jgi:hypothetical protein
VLTDRPPRQADRRAAFLASDALLELDLPADACLAEAGREVEAALARESRAAVQRACERFASLVASFHAVPEPVVRVLNARPLKTYRDGASEELYGDYDLEKGVVRIWMRTAVRRKVTSYGTLLATLCHELCHHLDVQKLGFPETPHTRGFYMRAARLYHEARGTPLRPLIWTERAGGRWQVDWARLRR